jgi:hypothetical protein
MIKILKKLRIVPIILKGNNLVKTTVYRFYVKTEVTMREMENVKRHRNDEMPNSDHYNV